MFSSKPPQCRHRASNVPNSPSKRHNVANVLTLQLHLHLDDAVHAQRERQAASQDEHLGLDTQEVAVPERHGAAASVEHPVGSEGRFRFMAEENAKQCCTKKKSYL